MLWCLLLYLPNLNLLWFRHEEWCRMSSYTFSVIDSFRWFWMESLHKNIQLMLEFLKGPFLVLHFSYYTLMTFLMILSLILLSVLMMLLSTLNVIRHLALLPYSWGRSTCYSDRLHNFSATIPSCYKDGYIAGFFLALLNSGILCL